MRRNSGFSPPPRGPPRGKKSGFSRDARSPAAKALGKPKRQSKFSDGPAPKRPRDDNDDAAARAKATLRDLQAKLRAPSAPRHGAVMAAPAPAPAAPPRSSTADAARRAPEAPPPPTSRPISAAEAARRARESLERTVADAALDAAVADALADAEAPAEPTEAELLWAPLTDESATGEEDWRALAPDGASPELLAALEAANELKAAARRMGAPQSRQKVLASLATLKRLASELPETDLDGDLGLRDVLMELKISSDRIVSGAARGLRAAWKDRAPPKDEPVAAPPKPAPAPPPPPPAPLPADTDVARLQRRVAALEAELGEARQALATERRDGEAARQKLRQSFNDARKKWARDEAELKAQRDAAKQKALTATDRAKRALELDRAALRNEPVTCDRCRRPVNPQRGGARVAKKASDRFATRR